MSPATPDDDPTHALDDFVRRMRPAAQHAAAADADADADLSDLQDGLLARLHPGRASGAAGMARPKGGTLRSGQTWDADDVVDVPEAPEVQLPRVAPARTDIPAVNLPIVDLVAEQAQAAIAPAIDLPPVATVPPPDAGLLDDTTRRASHAVAAQQDSEDHDNAEAGWQPGLQSLQLRRASHPRLLASWQPGAWTGAVREVLASTTEFVTTPAGTAVETYPPHRLLLLWPPQRLDAPTPSRWPQQVKLSAVPADRAADLLADLLPELALLWINPAAGQIDWALAAEIALHHDSTLRPFQSNGLRAFIAAEREATFAQLNADYELPAGPSGAVLRR
jgi:hypothetical protein